MLTKISAKEARDNFTDLLGAVYYGNQDVEIKKKGRPFAVVVNPDRYNAFKQAAKGKFFEFAGVIQNRNRGANPDGVLADVTREVEAVRQERYDKSR